MFAWWKGVSVSSWSHLPRPKPSSAVTACGESRIICFCASRPSGDDHNHAKKPGSLLLFLYVFPHPQSTGFRFWQACLWTPLEPEVLDGLGGFGNMPTALDSCQIMLPDMSTPTKDMTVSNTKPPCPVSHISEPVGTPRCTPLFTHRNKLENSWKPKKNPHDLARFKGPPMRKKRKAPKLSNGCKVAEENPMDKGVVSYRAKLWRSRHLNNSSTWGSRFWVYHLP